MKKLAAARAGSSRSRIGSTKGKGFRLRDVDPGDTAHLESADADRARETLQEGVELLAESRTSSTRRTAGRCC